MTEDIIRAMIKELEADINSVLVSIAENAMSQDLDKNTKISRIATMVEMLKDYQSKISAHKSALVWITKKFEA